MSEPAPGPGSWSGSGLGSAGRPATVRPIAADTLVALLEAGLDQVVLVDCRPFVDYNTSHILEAVNVNCSKLMKRRLQQDKVQITELLQHAAKTKVRLRPLTPPTHPGAQGTQQVCLCPPSSWTCTRAGMWWSTTRTGVSRPSSAPSPSSAWFS